MTVTTPLRTLLTGAVLVVAFVFTSCSTSEADGRVTGVDAREAVRLIESGDHVVLDLRAADAYAAGHVRGALSMPFHEAGFAERVQELAREERYLLYSRDPDIARQAGDLMVGWGFTHVVDAGRFGVLAIAGAPLASAEE